MQIRTFWKAREQTRKTMLIFAHQPQYSVIFVGRKLGRFGVPGFCVVCLLCLSTRPWGGPPRSGASQGLGIGNIMLVMQGKPNFQRITGATCAPPRPHRPPPWLDPDPPCRLTAPALALLHFILLYLPRCERGRAALSIVGFSFLQQGLKEV